MQPDFRPTSQPGPDRGLFHRMVGPIKTAPKGRLLLIFSCTCFNLITAFLANSNIGKIPFRYRYDDKKLLLIAFDGMDIRFQGIAAGFFTVNNSTV